MACNKGNEGNGPPPQDDPKNPNFICTNCHNNIFELCDQCMERINIQEIVAKIQKNKGKKSTEAPKTTESTPASDTQTISENKTPESKTSDSQSVLEEGVLEGHDMNAESDTSDGEKECEARPINQGDASAVLVSITKTDHHKYKYEFKYEPTANTAAANTPTTSKSDTKECEEINEEDNMDSDNSDSDTPILDLDDADNEEDDMDSDNSNSDSQILNLDNSDNDDPIVPDYLLSQDQEEPEDEEPIYDSDGQEVTPGHQL